MKNMYILVGPAGVGKTTVLNGIKKKTADRFVFLKTYTTRPLRTKEKPGDEHLFIGEDEFCGLLREGFWYEWTFWIDSYYGISKNDAEDAIRSDKSIFAILTSGGAISWKNKFPDNVYIFYLFPSPPERIISALIKRGEPEGRILLQMGAYLASMELNLKVADYLVEAGSKRSALDTIMKIVDNIEKDGKKRKRAHEK